MRMYDILEHKAAGKPLSRAEIQFFMDNLCQDRIPDYQTSALLMAIFLNGMADSELADWTDAMAKSGDLVDLSAVAGIKVDKHSTGGIGDKTTLILGPIIAACGGRLAKSPAAASASPAVPSTSWRRSPASAQHWMRPNSSASPIRWALP